MQAGPDLFDQCTHLGLLLIACLAAQALNRPHRYAGLPFLLLFPHSINMGDAKADFLISVLFEIFVGISVVIGILM